MATEVTDKAHNPTEREYVATVRNDPTTVLFVAGFGRSGSTLLGQILSGVPGFVHVGELNFIWEHNVLQNRDCGCGLPFRDCPFWIEVMGVAFGGMDVINAHEMVELQQHTTRTRHALQLLNSTTRQRVVEQSRPFIEATEKIYRAVRQVSGASVVVDSSKLPPYGFLQGQSDNVDLRCVHLVRDPRATAYSWLRRASTASDGGDGYLPPIGTVESSLTWTTWNLIAERLWSRDRKRYLRLRYEDFAADPQLWSRRACELAGVDNPSLPFDPDGCLNVGVSHTVAGNPNRFNSGAIRIRLDHEWNSLISNRQRLAATALTLPVLHRYGYRISRSRTP